MKDEKRGGYMKQKYKEYEELIGIENLTILSHVFGGSNIYIPKEKELQKREKYKKILEEFTGENTKELAEKYGISERTIYRVIKKYK